MIPPVMGQGMDGMAPEGGVRDAPLPAGDPQQAREVMAWEARIRQVQVQEAEQRMKMAKWRRTLAGDDGAADPGSVPDGVVVEKKKRDTNLIYSTFASALPLIYDSVADVRVTPAMSADDTHYELVRIFAKTASLVLKRYFVEEAALRQRMRSLARSTMCESIGWVKMAYTRDYDTEPYLKARPEDAQDEIARLQSLAQRLPAILDPDERMRMVQEIKGLREALFAQRDVLVGEGLVIDLLDPTDVVVSPDVVCLANGYRQAQWIAQGIWLPVDEAAARYQLSEAEVRSLRQAPGREGQAGTDLPAGPPTRADIVDGGAAAAGDTPRYVRAWEIWHRTSQRVLSIVEGLQRWAREPMRPERRPQRWYPFYCLAFNHVEHRRYPLSDVQLLASLQAEFQEIRDKFMEHRKSSIPKTAIDGSKVDSTDAKKFVEAPVGATVPLNGSKGIGPEVPLQNAFFVPDIPLPTPALYDSASVVGDMERVFGLGDAMRGAVVTPKTATEARQMQAATSGRMGERTSEILTLEEEMAADATEILLFEVSLERAKQIAGASAVWPQLDRKTIQESVSIRVMHESKAETEQKQQLWLSLSPQIQQMVMQIAQLRMAGLDLVAEPLVEIMRETLRRYDDRIDIERFLPGGPLQAGVPLPAELQDAAAGAVAPVNAQQLSMLMAIMGQGQGAGAGPPQAGGGAPGGGGGAAGYNPASGGMGPPRAQGASVQSGGMT